MIHVLCWAAGNANRQDAKDARGNWCHAFSIDNYNRSGFSLGATATMILMDGR